MRINSITPEEWERRADRVQGCLFGGAVGDALGYTVEFWSEGQIFARYGGDGIRSYQSAGGKARISDDTQMSLFTAAGVLRNYTQNALEGVGDGVAAACRRAYLDWLLTQEMDWPHAEDAVRRGSSWLCGVPALYSQRAPGNTCLSALWELRKTGGAFASNHSKGCGGVMRAAPVALPYPDGDLAALARAGADAARVTHGHALGWLPAAVLTHIVHRCVFPRAAMTLREIVAEAKDAAAALWPETGHLRELTALLELAMDLSENGAPDLDNIHRLGEGWTGDEALVIAVYCALRHPDDFSAGVAAAVNHRGDSDSTGAVAGNILGARLGYARIEDKWKENLELADVILELADDLARCPYMEREALAEPAWAEKYLRGDR